MSADGQKNSGQAWRPTLFWSYRPWLPMRKSDRQLRLNYFQHREWHIEFDESPIAVLSDPKYDDNFWYTYAIRILQNRSAVEDFLAFEAEVARFKVRHVKTGLIADGAFPASMYLNPNERSRALSTGRVLLRHVYARIPAITWYEQLILKRKRLDV